MSPEQRRLMVRTTRTAVPALVVLLGVLIAVVLIMTGPTADLADEDRRAPQVQVFAAKPIAVRRQWQGYGTVRPQTAADVPARVTATVLDVPDHIDPGVTVKKGDLLVQLDPSDFERQVEMAEQNLAQLDAQISRLSVEESRLRERLELGQRDVDLAEAEHTRLRQLVERGAANQQDMDRTQRALIDAQRLRNQTAEALDVLVPRRAQLVAQQSAQQSALRLAKQDLERASIVSPIDGVVQAVDVEQGESVTAGQRVARVVALNVIEVPVRLPSASRRHINIGDEVVLQPTNRGSEACFAFVTRIAPEDDPTTRTTTIYVTVDQTRFTPEARLTPGGFVTASVTNDQAQARWVVPRRSIRGGRVLLVQHGVVHSAPVTVDFALEGPLTELGLPDEQWAVLEDFPGEPGQLVMVNASQSVLDGERVEPVVAAVADIAARKSDGQASRPGGDLSLHPSALSHPSDSEGVP